MAANLFSQMVLRSMDEVLLREHAPILREECNQIAEFKGARKVSILEKTYRRISAVADD